MLVKNEWLGFATTQVKRGEIALRKAMENDAIIVALELEVFFDSPPQLEEVFGHGSEGNRVWLIGRSDPALRFGEDIRRGTLARLHRRRIVGGVHVALDLDASRLTVELKLVLDGLLQLAESGWGAVEFHRLGITAGFNPKLRCV